MVEDITLQELIEYLEKLAFKYDLYIFSDVNVSR